MRVYKWAASTLGGLVAVAGLLAGAEANAQTDTLQRDRVTGAIGARLDAQLTRFAEYGFSGAIIVARDGQILLLKGYGLADVERGIANTAATRFEMNSMTKMFTGVATLQLAAEGKLRVSDPLERHLGAFPASKRGATVEALASHTAGLVVAGATVAVDNREAFVRDMKSLPRESEPGAQYRYTNAGFSLLAALIESVSGKTYEDYLRTRIFPAAGMSTAIFRDDVPPADPRFARGYVGTPDSLQRGPPNPYMWSTRGAGGVWSTIGDMYRWMLAMESNALLDAAHREILFAQHKPPSVEMYGIHVDTAAGGRPMIHKGGGSTDFASQVRHYPRDRATILWASNNLRQRWRQTLNRDIESILFGGTDVVSLPPIVPSTTFRAGAGRYVANGDTLELRAGERYLYAGANRLGVPVDVMFFPNDTRQLTAFDPATRQITRLMFDGASLVVQLNDGKRIALTRSR